MRQMFDCNFKPAPRKAGAERRDLKGATLEAEGTKRGFLLQMVRDK